MIEVVSGIFEPAIAALTVSLCTRDVLTPGMGRNAGWSLVGNSPSTTSDDDVGAEPTTDNGDQEVQPVERRGAKVPCLQSRTNVS